LLGRNGSGKSTLIRILLGILDPTRGSATVLGNDCRQMFTETRGRIGYIAEGHPLIDWMRVRELQAFQKSFYPRWNTRIFEAVIDHFAIDPSARARQLSHGQRAGVSLALAMAPQPELLVMDDPAMGLDPVARRTLLEGMILMTRDAGHTIFFSSHVLDDVERVADQVAILDRNTLRVACPVETFRERVTRVVLSFPSGPPRLPPIPGLLRAQRERDRIALTLANYGPDTRKVIDKLGIVGIEESALSLEDAAIAYLGERGERSSLLAATQMAGEVS
jgi:ABC-2 type transport system ATP-binding protein